MLASFLVGLLLLTAASQADYCNIVLSDNNKVYTVNDLTLTAFLPVLEGDVFGYDIYGNDLPNMPLRFNMTGLGASCRAACTATRNCRYYAYNMCEDGNAGACWLKTAMQTPSEHGCRAYGFIDNTVPHDTGGANYTMNLCRATSCGRYSTCQLCQNVGTPRSQYCTGNDDGALYSALSSPYNANGATGYDMSFYGDSLGCPDNRPRESIVHVVCNQPRNEFVFVAEPTTCTYQYVAYLQGDCKFTPPVPGLDFSNQTKSSVKISILPDNHLFHLDYPLTITYNVWLESDLIYSGSVTKFIATFPTTPAASYTFRVQGVYNDIASAQSEGKNIPAVTNDLPLTFDIQNMIDVLGLQVDQIGQQLQTRIDAISSLLDVDIIQVLRHADDAATNVRERLFVISNTTLVNIANDQNKLTTTINGYNGKFAQLSQRIQDQGDALQRLSDKQAQTNAGTTKSSGGGVSGAGIAVGMLIGVVAGIAGAVLGPKLYQKVAGSGGYRRANPL